MLLPWQPLYTIERAGRPEVTIAGIITVIDANQRTLLSVGDADALLWSRSLLKPWQLLTHLPVLQNAYPHLNSAHYALMLSSHNHEAIHLDYLQQLLTLGDINPEYLQCPSLKFHNGLNEVSSNLFHPCSGKHIGYLLALKAQAMELSDYAQSQAPHFTLLKTLLSWLTNRPLGEIAETVDGCMLPNYALSAKDLAQLYAALLEPIAENKINQAPIVIRPLMEQWIRLKEIMLAHPILIGGHTRLDSSLIAGQLTNDKTLNIIAKEGADGLLAVGLSGDRLKSNLGILIKLASGYDANHLKIIIVEIMQQLGLSSVYNPVKEKQQLNKIFHFNLH